MEIILNIDAALSKASMTREALFDNILENFNIDLRNRVACEDARAVRLSTLSALCETLQCRPDDLLLFR